MLEQCGVPRQAVLDSRLTQQGHPVPFIAGPSPEKVLGEGTGPAAEIDEEDLLVFGWLDAQELEHCLQFVASAVGEAVAPFCVGGKTTVSRGIESGAEPKVKQQIEAVFRRPRLGKHGLVGNLRNTGETLGVLIQPMRGKLAGPIEKEGILHFLAYDKVNSTGEI